MKIEVDVKLNDIILYIHESVFILSREDASAIGEKLLKAVIEQLSLELNADSMPKA